MDGFFNPGNILTLGIVILVLILYRRLDLRSRSLDQITKHAEKLKEGIKVIAENSANEVRDFSVELKVEKEAGKELIKRLHVTNEELAEKAEKLAQIDERLQIYGSSIDELQQMTVLVQENLSRLQNELVFVDGLNNRLSQAKSGMSSLEKDFEGLHIRFERENEQALEKIASDVLASVKFTVSELSSEAEIAGQKVEDHRLAISRIEKEREASLSNSVEQINSFLKNAFDQAAQKADRMEEAAFLKLKDQAYERIKKLQTAEEEKIKSYQEGAKARVLEVQNLIKTVKEEWRTDRLEYEIKDKLYREAIEKNIEDSGKVLISKTDELLLKAEAETQAALENFRKTQTAELKQFESSQNEYIQAVQKNMETSLSERQNWEEKDKMLRDKLSMELDAIKANAASIGNKSAVQIELIENRLDEFRGKTDETISNCESQLVKTVEEIKHKALEAAESKLEEYRETQAGELKHLESLFDDAKKLDSELRRYMQNTVDRVRNDFDIFANESQSLQKSTEEEFNKVVSELKTGFEDIEKDLARLESMAHEDFADRLKIFESDFVLELGKRNNEIDKRLSEWQQNHENRLSDMEDESLEERRKLEVRFNEETKKNIALQQEKLSLELERLKAETGALEESIRGRMNSTDESLAVYKEHLENNLEEARQNAEHTIKAEIGNYALAAAEKIKQSQRELDGRIGEIQEFVENKNISLVELIEVSRKNISELDERASLVRNVINDAYQDADLRRNEIINRSEEHAKSLDSSVKEAERHIKEFFDQTKLIDEAKKFKMDLERTIEDLKGDIARLEQKRVEVIQIEDDFSKINRLGNEVTAKWTRIGAEKYRIDKMEADFNRLIQISRNVEEKLEQVTSSDDILQETLVQIRKFEDALNSADEKFHRLEKKEQILTATSDGIDRDFKNLNELEKAIKRMGEDLTKLVIEKNELSKTLNLLAEQNEKAKETAERITALDDALDEVNEKAKSLQVAREWIVRAEARLNELNKQTHTQSNIVQTMLDGKKESVPLGPGMSPLQKRESVIQLARKGFKKDEIAKTMKIPLGEVEIILETFFKN